MLINRWLRIEILFGDIFCGDRIQGDRYLRRADSGGDAPSPAKIRVGVCLSRDDGVELG